MLRAVAGALGGTVGGAVSGGTPGSVLFVDSSGNLGQDNSNFFYDQTDKQLLIGTSTLPTGTGTNSRIICAASAPTDGTNPSAITVSNLTNAAGWTVNGKVCALNFQNNDVSGSGGIRAQIAMYPGDVQASTHGLEFYTDNNSGSNVLSYRLLPNGDINVGGGQVSNSSGVRFQVERNDGFTTMFLAKQNSAAAGVGIGLDRPSNVRSSVIDYRVAGTTEWSAGMFYNAGAASTGYHVGTGIPDAINTKFFISTAGDVAIGNTNPQAKLHLNGSILYQYRSVTSTNNATLNANNSGIIYDNTGATALTTHGLPSATSGLTFAWFVADADGYRVQAPAGVTVYIGSTASSVGGYVQSVVVGSMLRLVALNATTWFAVEMTGTWTAA